jgi:hypothetical protein
MKNLLHALPFVFLLNNSDALASDTNSSPLLKQTSILPTENVNINQIDSGFFSAVKKGYEIASKMTIDDVGKIANIVLFNNNKSLDHIMKDVGTYVNQINKAQKDLRNIKINKNTKIIVKRDK